MSGTWGALSWPTRHVAAVYWIHANGRTGELHVSAERAAAEAGVSQRTVFNANGELEAAGLMIPAGWIGRCRRRAVKKNRGGDAFAVYGEVMHVLPELRGRAWGVYVALRAVALDTHVTAFWAEENRELRAEYYAAGDVDTLEGGYCDEKGGKTYPMRPYIVLTRGKAVEIARLGGIKDTYLRRARQGLNDILRDLEDRGLVKTVEDKYKGTLIFPLPKPGLWNI